MSTSESITQPCDCAALMDQMLASHNGRLVQVIKITKSGGLVGRLRIQTEKLCKASRKPAPVVVASHCPFCGVKLSGVGVAA